MIRRVNSSESSDSPVPFVRFGDAPLMQALNSRVTFYVINPFCLCDSLTSCSGIFFSLLLGVA